MSLESLDLDWDSFNLHDDFSNIESRIDTRNTQQIPQSSDITISTQTLISFFNQSFPLKELFWKLPIIPYHSELEGIIKKQIKLTSFSKEDVESIKKKVEEEKMISTHVISSVKDSTFKHVQKINVGLCKKDVLNTSLKEKGAFYNCFALIVRIKEDNVFKEIHMKLFNTGKVETPGIKNKKTLLYSLEILQNILQSLVDTPLYFNPKDITTVLINSNFNCGYYIHREKLYNILRKNYNIISLYDPCSYPGIQCKFYYNDKHQVQNGICTCKKRCNKKGKGNGEGDCSEISFMIFRTGSVLIVGNCNETILHIIYNFLKTLFVETFTSINNGLLEDTPKIKVKKKVKKKVIYV